MLLCSVVTAICVLVLLLSEAKEIALGKWIAKPLASTSFIAASLLSGAPTSWYGRLVVLALVLSWWGDVLLIPKSQKIFLLGILSFLSAHIAYAAAFIALGVSPSNVVVAALLLGGVGVVIGRYFISHAPEKLKKAVVAYIAVLSTMVALAIGTFGVVHNSLILIAAIGFYFSDISVAINRFVKPSLVHRAWGAPLYFASQLVFAYTVANP